MQSKFICQGNKVEQDCKNGGGIGLEGWGSQNLSMKVKVNSKEYFVRSDHNSERHMQIGCLMITNK